MRLEKRLEFLFVANRPVLHNRQTSFAQQPLHNILVHTNGGSKHPGADVRNVCQFEKALYGAVLSVGAVEHRKDDVDNSLAGWFGGQRDGLTTGQYLLDLIFGRQHRQCGLGCEPPPLVRDANRHDVIFISIDGFDDRFCRPQRYFVLARTAAENDADSNLFHCCNTSRTTAAAFSMSLRSTSRCVTIRTLSLSTGTARTFRFASV